MTPLHKLTNIEVGTQVSITDEHGNLYSGEFDWDSEDEVHKVDGFKIVANYRTDELFIVKSIDDDTISGFLAEIISIKELS